MTSASLFCDGKLKQYHDSKTTSRKGLRREDYGQPRTICAAKESWLTRKGELLPNKEGKDEMLPSVYTLTYFVSLLPLWLYDLFCGTEYGGIDRNGDRDGHFAYFPSSVFSFPFLKGYIKKHLSGGRGHSVLDIGCGKGFVLLFFSRLRFDAVAGIEYDKKLCCLAKNNLWHSGADANVYYADAADYTGYVHYDTFYLYNPFDKAILKQCIGRITASLKERPRKLVVFYCNPVYGSILKEKGFREEGHFYYKTRVFVLDGGKSGQDKI